MTSIKPAIVTLATLGFFAVSGAMAQTATSEPTEMPMMQNQGGAMMQGQGMQGQGRHGHGMQDGTRQGDRRGMRDRDGPRFGRMGPDMMVMMMIMVDTNGDGALSLEEVQAVHARIFNYADTDDDGRLTLDELRSFFHGGAGPGKR